MIKVKTRGIQKQLMQCVHGAKVAITYGIPTIQFQLSFLYYLSFRIYIYKVDIISIIYWEQK